MYREFACETNIERGNQLNKQTQILTEAVEKKEFRIEVLIRLFNGMNAKLMTYWL